MKTGRVVLIGCVIIAGLPAVGHATTQTIYAPFEVQAYHDAFQPLLLGSGEGSADASADPDGTGRARAEAVSRIGVPVGVGPVGTGGSGPAGQAAAFIRAHSVVPRGVTTVSFTAHVHVTYVAALRTEPVALDAGPYAMAGVFFIVRADCACQIEGSWPISMFDSDEQDPITDRSVDMVTTISTTDGSDLPQDIEITLELDSQARAASLEGSWSARADAELLSIDVTY